MPAHYQKFHCSLCEKQIGAIVTRTVQDLNDIYDSWYRCYQNGAGMACPQCLDKLKAADVAIDK